MYMIDKLISYAVLLPVRIHHGLLSKTISA